MNPVCTALALTTPVPLLYATEADIVAEKTATPESTGMGSKTGPIAAWYIGDNVLFSVGLVAGGYLRDCPLGRGYPWLLN